MNAATPNAEAAKTFLTWVASSEFAELCSTAPLGFYSLSNEPVTVQDPLAAEFVSWRENCEETIRNLQQIPRWRAEP